MKTNELNELQIWKVGMEVIVYSRFSSSIQKIKKITDGRGGTIYVEIKGNNYLFDVLGNLRTSNVWSSITIEPCTPEKKIEIQMKNRVAKLHAFDFSSLTDQQVSDIVLFMREKGINI